MLRFLRLALALTALLAAGSLVAQTATKAPAPAAATADDVEEIEDVEAVEVVPPAAEARADAKRGGWQDVAGRMHNAVVHVPIGWLMMVLLLDLLAFAFRRRELEAAGLWALGAALLSFLPGIGTGLLREGFVSPLPAVHALIETHETLIFVTAGTAAAAFLWRLGFRNRFVGVRKGVYLVLIVAAVLLVAIAGHWGGKVAWGEEYLPF